MGKVVKPMNPYLAKLDAEVSQREDLSVLEVLYDHYREYHPADNDAIRQKFSHLNDILKNLPPQEYDRIWDLACTLCGEYDREGFLDGVCTGVKLVLELIAEKPAV